MADVKEQDLPKIASYSDIKEVRLVKTDGTSTGMAIDTFINQIAEKVARVDGFASVVAELLQITNFYSGEMRTNTNTAIGIAQTVVESLPKDNITFSIIHDYAGRRHVFGYIYGAKLYGCILINRYEGFSEIVDIKNGEYTLRG